MSNKLWWVDIETGGLDPEVDLLLEVGLVVTDLNLNWLGSHSVVVGWPQSMLKRAMDSNPYVHEMHRANGLWEESAKSTYSLDEAAARMSAFAYEYGVEETDPLHGSSLALDRRFLDVQMPVLHQLFHYRSVDVSSFKEVCRRYNPELYAKLPESETDHRVFSCLKGSISEFSFYLENFIFTGDDL